MVLSGLSVGGAIRRIGEVLDIPDTLPLEPNDQASKWNGKVYYVAVNSKYDNVPSKNILRKQEHDLTAVEQVNVNGQLSIQGMELIEPDQEESILDKAVSKADEVTDQKNTIPEYYDSQQTAEFTGMNEDDEDEEVDSEDVDGENVEDDQEEDFDNIDDELSAALEDVPVKKGKRKKKNK